MVDRADIERFLSVLSRLDDLLEQAVVATRTQAAEPFRGLYITEDDVDALLARKVMTHPWNMNPDTTPEILAKYLREIPALVWLERKYNLKAFDLCILLVTLAPEIDLRYEGLFAYLQDNVTRRRPSVDLILNLLCKTADERIACRIHFAAQAPLFAHGLLHLFEDPIRPHTPLLVRTIAVDEQIANFIFGNHILDRRLTNFCERIDLSDQTAQLISRPDLAEELHMLVNNARFSEKQVVLAFYGPSSIEKLAIAESIAAYLGTSLLVVDLSRIDPQDEDIADLIEVATREAALSDSVFYVDGIDTFLLREPTFDLYRLLRKFTHDPKLVILSWIDDWEASPEVLLEPPMEIIRIPFPPPDYEQRRLIWQMYLAESFIVLTDEELDTLTGRFRLTSGEIRHAIASACSVSNWRRPSTALNGNIPKLNVPNLADLLAAARAQAVSGLDALAYKIEPLYTWIDIVLPNDSLAQLRELCQRVDHQHQVFDQWGFNGKLSLGRGIAALFSGPSGTGKTMAAEIIAAELGLDLYRINLAGIVSKYIGETEKNLDRIFTAAENSNAILFFDEADAIFGKRSEVQDSHDRYANIEVSYLLQKMEQYDGVAILATNLRNNLDDAFMRRLTFVIHFPFPDEINRHQIWNGIWPAKTPLDADVDLEFMARQFKLSGGNIKNIALAAAFLAAEQHERVGMAHLLHATQREYQKLGKALSSYELYGERLNEAAEN